MHEQIRKRFWNSHSCCLVVLYFNSVLKRSEERSISSYWRTHSQILFSLLRISPSLLSTSSYPSSTTTTTTTLTYFSTQLPFSSSFFSPLASLFLVKKERRRNVDDDDGMVGFSYIFRESLTEHNFQKGSWKMQRSSSYYFFVTYSTCLPALVIVSSSSDMGSLLGALLLVLLS